MSITHLASRKLAPGKVPTDRAALADALRRYRRSGLSVAWCGSPVPVFR